MKNNKIEIYINGKKKIVNKSLNLQKILKKILIKNQLFAVELNNEVIPKSQYKNKEVVQNDKIEILELIGGG
ncbi:MAG: thiamine biosynthesis protein ThiS [Rickettsiales bacterium]|nr:thiamine biosynthesis protein ThiS [Rickettsiales bacterium]OUV83282.1 MAG: thiamine biosynthesis protein ThiS [Rickettsiales bacterium TMED131]